MQIELWVTERQFHYRSFGFFAALLERIPLIGMAFSVSNQIGAAMWAHDLEKKQQRVRESGQDAKTEYVNKPTLKKLYKEAQKIDHQDVPAIVENEAQQGAPIRTDHFAGEGLAVLRSHSLSNSSERTAVFTHLSFTFPLKLISPGTSSRNATRAVFQKARQSQSQFGIVDQDGTPAAAKGSAIADGAELAKAVAVLYIVGYGGGLISGDKVDLDVDVGHHCTMLVLTQGSTKVFKRRHTRPTATTSAAASATLTVPPIVTTTEQNFRFLVRPNATLILLPDPVTCYAASRYDQVQRFDVRCKSTSSLMVLDWITPGRTAVRDPASSAPVEAVPGQKSYAADVRSAELWAFEAYRSRNEVRVQGEVVARDVLLLDQDLHCDVRVRVDNHGTAPHERPSTSPKTWLETDLARRNSPYSCYATLLLHGPDARKLIFHLSTEFQNIQQRTTTHTADVIWSMSLVERDTQTMSSAHENPGLAVVRVGGRTTEHVRTWLRTHLTSPQAELHTILGPDLLRQAFG